MSAAPRIKVMHVINSIGLGGVPEAAYQILRGLSPKAYDRSLVIMRRVDETDEGRLARYQRFKDLGIPCHVLEAADHKLAAVTQMVSLLEEQRIDILHCHSYRPNLFARLAGTIASTRSPSIVAHYHNEYDANWERDGTLPLDRALCRKSRALIACSGAVADHIATRLDQPRSAIDVIHNGVEIDRFRNAPDRRTAREALGLPLDRPIVSLVGRISPLKNQTGLIEAAPAILKAAPDTLFVFAGNPDEAVHLDALKEAIAAKGLENSVQLLGFVRDTPALYAATDVLAAPSLWEGFGLMLVEAMAAGVPIVASRVGGIPEVVRDGETALLVAPDDNTALSSAIIRQLSDSTAQDAMRKKSRDRALLFTWGNATREVEAVYARVLGKERA